MEQPTLSAESLASVVGSGDKGAALRALRDVLARAIDGSDSGRDIAALSARLADVLDKLDSLPATKKGTALDELAQRRASGDGPASRPVRSSRK